MFAKFVLVIILMAPDGGQYKDFVSVFDSEKECLEAKTSILTELRKAAPTWYSFAACVKPRALTAAET